MPCLGYGIRYEYGIFQQEIIDGWQVEKTDKWLRFGNPWEIARPEWAVEVKFGGHTERYTDEQGRLRVRWVPARIVSGVPYDTPILGYRVHTANTLRLWRAEAPESFDFSVFNRGDYWGAVNQKVISENISKVLYPNDEQLQGKELRLEQQYFFVCASLQDMLRIIHVQNIPPEHFHEKFAVQLNDTHPSIAIAELMRLLVDDLGDRVGARLVDHTGHLRLHQPHADARGARTLARRAVRQAAAAASGDHLRDQCAFSRRGAHRLLRRRAAPGAHVADR